MIHMKVRIPRLCAAPNLTEQALMGVCALCVSVFARFGAVNGVQCKMPQLVYSWSVPTMQALHDHLTLHVPDMTYPCTCRTAAAVGNEPRGATCKVVVSVLCITLFCLERKQRHRTLVAR